jgi:hypothetical protein
VRRWALLVQDREIPLPLGECIIGRSTACGAYIDDAIASRQHARLRVTDDSVTIEDLGSRNGTHVDGRLIGSVCPLSPGSRITIGGTLLTLFDRTDGVRPARTTPATLVREATAAPHDAASHAPARESPPPQHRTRTALPDRQLIDRAREALDRGALDECAGATAIVVRRLTNLGPRAPGDLVHDVSAVLVDLARKRDDRSWIEGVFQVYGAAGRIIATELVDAMITLPPGPPLRNVPTYLGLLRGRSEPLTDAERATLARIQSLA